MIKNVPSPEDFGDQGILFLNLAWDTVFQLLHDYSEIIAYYGNMFSDEEINANEEYKEYWQAAKKPLSIAHALSQQGAELILKAKIAQVSPYFIIASSPKDWPSRCDKKDIDFADFRTIDAQDLIRVHNTVCEEVLSEDFLNTFNNFRKQRNAIFHTVDYRLVFSEEIIVSYILEIADLNCPKKWPHLRNEYLENKPLPQAVGTDDTPNQLCNEMDLMINLLGHKKLIRFFDFDKKQRRYVCPNCYWSMNRDYDPSYPTTAQLKPNAPDSTNVYCFVCQEDITVIRNQCKTKDCKGNVIRADDDKECLTCFESQE